MLNITRFASERSKKVAQGKSYKNAYNYKQYKVAGCIGRNPLWGAVYGGLGAEPPAAGGTGVRGQSPQRLKILHFFSKIT